MIRCIQNFSRLALLFLFSLSLISTARAAVTLNDYEKSLKSAITALDTLSQIDDEESAAEYEQRVSRTIEGIKTTLPEKQSVDSGGTTCEIDNSWLHQGLRELAVASESQRDRLRNQLIERLRSIDERVDELNKATSLNVQSKTDSQRKLSEILSRPEYGTENKQTGIIFRYIFKLMERLIRWLARFFPHISATKGSVNPVTWVAEIFIIGLAVALIGYAVLKLVQMLRKKDVRKKVRKSKEPKIVLGERLEPDASATDLLAEAEALARQGEIRAAIRKAYIALLVELGDRNVISLAQHKTNRDYLRSVRSRPVLYQNMSGLTDSFERHWYGFVQTTPNDWQNFRSGYLAATRTTE